MSRRTLCSTGAVTRWPDRTDHRDIVRLAGSLPCDALELGFYASWYDDLDRVVRDLAESGLRFGAVHADKRIGRALGAGEEADAVERLEANCATARALGASIVVLHLWELPEGDRNLERNLASLGACLDIADGAGVTLAVETIPCSVGRPIDNVRRALERDARCRVTLDTEFLALHGQLQAAAVDRELVRATAHVHVKDFDGAMRDGDGRRRYLIPGEGDLPLDDFLSALERAGYGGAVTLEATALAADGTIDEARLERIREALRLLAAT